MEKAVGGIAVGVAENLVGKGLEIGVRLVIFEKTAGDVALLVTAEE